MLRHTRHLFLNQTAIAVTPGDTFFSQVTFITVGLSGSLHVRRSLPFPLACALYCSSSEIFRRLELTLDVSRGESHRAARGGSSIYDTPESRRICIAADVPGDRQRVTALFRRAASWILIFLCWKRGARIDKNRHMARRRGGFGRAEFSWILISRRVQPLSAAAKVAISAIQLKLKYHRAHF